jgi:hypothetical protein
LAQRLARRCRCLITALCRRARICSAHMAKSARKIAAAL